MGINVSGVNPDHLPEDVRAERTTDKGFKINFIECSIDKSTKERLFNKLKSHYGAIDIEDYEGIIKNIYINHATWTRVRCNELPF